MSKRRKLEDRRSELPRSSQHEQWLIDLWGVHQALRNCGFIADDIFVGFGNVLNVGFDTVYVVLRTQGKEYTYTVAQVPGSTEAEVFRQWVAFINDMRATPLDRLDKIGRQSKIYADRDEFFSLVATIAKKGIEIPQLPEGMGAIMALFGHDAPPLKTQGDA